MKGVLRKFEWQDYTVLGLVILFSVLLALQYSSYKQLPSPIYGGDLYFQLGAVNHVKYGGNPFKSSSTLEGLPAYFPIYSLLTGYFARIFNINAMTAMFICSIIYVDIGIIILYLLFKNFFPKEIAISSVIIYGYSLVFLRGILKYTEFSTFVVFPLFLLFLVYFFKSKKKFLWASLSGLMYGVASLSHAEEFFIITLAMPLLFLYLLFFQYYDFKKFDKKKIKKEWKKNLLYFLLIFIIGFAIAQIYWHVPIGQALSKNGGITFKSEAVFTFPFVLKYVLSRIFLFKSPISSIITILFITGLVFPFVLKRRTKEIKLIYSLCFLLLLFPFHFIITHPLLGLDFVPTHMFLHIKLLVVPLIASYGIMLLTNIWKNNTAKKYIALSLFILILILTLSGYNHYLKTNTWVKQGKNPLSPQLVMAAEWINKNTNVNDVFISTKETGSAINALTGRKFLSVRYNQMPPFLDLYQREADLAIILYGNNSKMREELLKKYHVKYLYWDFYWFSTEFSLDKSGKIIGFFDPITVFANKHFLDYFKEGGVNFVTTAMTIDPSKRNNPNFKKEQVLVAMPAKTDFYQPWSDGLNNSLSLMRDFKIGNSSVAKIFKIANPFS